MKYAKYATMVLMLALIVGFSTPQAAAQQGFQGSFDLPTEAYLGPTLLPAGHYRITMNPDPTQNVRLVRVVSEDLQAFVLVGSGTPEDISEKNSLQLENRNGVYVVRHLQAGLVGRSYTFMVSKNARMTVQQASNASAPVAVPIATSGATE